MKIFGQIRRRIQPWIAARFPLVRHYARMLKWRVVHPILRASIRRKTKASGLHVDPYAVYWIPVGIMKHTIYGPEDVPNPANVSGMIKDGDWDKNILPVEDLDIVRGARSRFVQHMSWQETEYYRNWLDDILSDSCSRYAIRTKEDLDKHCARLDCLYEEIRDNGYKPQSELREPEYGNAAPVEHEIVVHIDRDGRFLFCDGRRRLSTALALGIEKIPVKVCIRHAKWQEFCNEILAHAKKSRGNVYQPLTHPDLQNIPSAHGEERFSIIRDHLPQSKGSLLDIGANWGYFCHRFEQLGFDCYAVEADPQNVYFMEKPKIASDCRFKIITTSIFAYDDKHNFDVVLALNIFHHFLKKKEDYHRLINFLQKLDTKTMFFEPHHTSEPQMINAYRNYEPDEFVQFILKHSTLKSSDLIGKAEDERPIYRLWQ